MNEIRTVHLTDSVMILINGTEGLSRTESGGAAAIEDDPIVLLLRAAIRGESSQDGWGAFIGRHRSFDECRSEVESRRYSLAADLARIRGQLDLASELSSSAIQYARTSANRRLLADALIIDGAIQYVSGNRLDALRAWESARHVFDFEMEDAVGALRASSLIAVALKSRGNWSAAEETLARAIETHAHVESNQADAARARIHANLAVIQTRLGKLHEARNSLATASRIASTSTLPAALQNATLLRSEHYRLSGEFRAAAAGIRAVRAWAVERGDARTEGLCHEYLGDVRADQEQYGVALKHLDRALQLARVKFPETDMVCEAQRRRAEVLAGLQRVEEAREAAEEALRVSHRIGEPYEVALAHRARARVSEAEGNCGQALREVTECLDILTDLGEKFERGRTLLLRGRILREAGPFAAATESFEAARRLFSEMELANWTERAADLLLARGDSGAPRIVGVGPGSRVPLPEQYGIITRDPRMLADWRDLVRAAASNMPILIEGESGTGKELIAQAVHQLSGRQDREFVPVNCGAVPRDMQEAEFFGHARGSFTGATEDRPGLFETAHGGTLFLDEIGEMAPAAQVKLLRAIETGQIRRVGDRQQRRIDVRYVAATNVGIQRAIAEGRFRSDLFYRLDGYFLSIPPLRERRSDVPLLVEHLLELAARQHGRRMQVGESLMGRLMAQEWPGNVRELKNRIFRAVALAAEPGELTSADFPALSERELPAPPALASDLVALERARILQALSESGWSKSAAARLLKLQRTTLHSRMERLGIPIRKPVRPPRDM